MIESFAGWKPDQMTITKIDGMLKSRVPGNESRDVYGHGAIRDAFLACIAGTELKSLPDISTVRDFLLGKHLSASGRCGWHWETLVDGVLTTGPLDLSKLKSTAKIKFVNAEPIDAMVNSKFHRGSAVTLADVLAAKSARLAMAESKPASDQIIDVVPVMLALPAGDGVVTESAPNRKTRRAAAAKSKSGK